MNQINWRDFGLALVVTVGSVAVLIFVGDSPAAIVVGILGLTTLVVITMPLWKRLFKSRKEKK